MNDDESIVQAARQVGKEQQRLLQTSSHCAPLICYHCFSNSTLLYTAPHCILPLVRSSLNPTKFHKAIFFSCKREKSKFQMMIWMGGTAQYCVVLE